jgi:hypothetical protein
MMRAKQRQRDGLSRSSSHWDRVPMKRAERIAVSQCFESITHSEIREMDETPVSEPFIGDFDTSQKE